MALDYAALKTELTTDPTSIGYAAALAIGSDWQCADLLNAPRQTIDVWRGLLPSHEVIGVVVWSEWTALSAANKQLLQTLTGPNFVDTANANIRTAFTTMFGAATATRTALAALATRKGSRAEQLWGVGTTISSDDVAKAKRA